ncbi:Ribosomal protein L25 [Cinnamomum micranthum f. kanehirae]|uniref:Ribosomal protein L25 n=1 Tax=Cinnamomum micranthum f. kanehirae TaxID=337451 RepID=A0A443ND03_9MAGN|nr:Ribosomal protein L25 [Cinnamomum micranthum f. kanehirae]
MPAASEEEAWEAGTSFRVLEMGLSRSNNINFHPSLRPGMWIHRPLMIRKSIGLRFLSHVASEALVEDPAPLFTYLEGFPRPEPKYAETILAIPRSKSGKNISAKEREAGRVPSIVFEQLKGEEGGNKRLISVQTKQIRKLVNHLGYSFFLSRLFDLEIRSNIDSSDEIIERVRVLPRKLHLHSGTDAVLNVTFLRAPSHACLKVDVPLAFRGDDVCPGLRKGAYLNTIKRTVKYLCPADIVPPYIDVDLSELDVGQKLVMGDLKVHPALRLLQSAEEPVCKIMGSRVSQEQKKSK